MNEHSIVSDLLPVYVSGALEANLRSSVERHLGMCAECQADLALWKEVSAEIVAGNRALTAAGGLVERALAEAKHSRPASAHTSPLGGKIRRVWQLLRSQMPLVHREIWPASTLVIALGFVAALLSAHAAFIYALAPLVAAACISLIYGAENDPAFELALSTPTSPRQILLARLVLVFGYNLGLALVASVGLLLALANQPSPPVLETLVLAWLGPMTFLSAAALVISLWIGASSAISLTYIAWLAQLLVGPLHSPQSGLILPPEALAALTGYQSFWQATPLLLALSALLFAAAVWIAWSG